MYFSRPPLYDKQNISIRHSLKVRSTYVYHESTTEIPSLSNLLMCCCQRTIRQSLSVEPSQRIFDSSMDQEGKASVRHPVAACHLQHIVGFSNKQYKRSTNALFCLFRLTLGEERLRTRVSTGDTCSASVTYPNPVEYYPLMPCHLTK